MKTPIDVRRLFLMKERSKRTATRDPDSNKKRERERERDTMPNLLGEAIVSEYLETSIVIKRKLNPCQ